MERILRAHAGAFLFRSADFIPPSTKAPPLKQDRPYATILKSDLAIPVNTRTYPDVFAPPMRIGGANLFPGESQVPGLRSQANST